jgi:hypothetical protein
MRLLHGGRAYSHEVERRRLVQANETAREGAGVVGLNHIRNAPEVCAWNDTQGASVQVGCGGLVQAQ